MPLQLSRPHLDVRVSCEVADPAEGATFRFHRAHESGSLECRVPLSWLLTCWAPGAALVEGRLTLDAVPATGRDVLDATVMAWRLRGAFGAEPELCWRLVGAVPGGSWCFASVAESAAAPARWERR